MGTIDLKVGLGTLRIRGAIDSPERKFLEVSVISVNGPCSDESCQVIRKVVARLSRPADLSRYVTIEVPGLSVFLEKEVFDSIDMGRSTVAAKVMRSGKVVVSGISIIT
ncbi:MAG: hypothetical protein ACP5NK_07490 [Thermoplasmata archaeon]